MWANSRIFSQNILNLFGLEYYEADFFSSITRFLISTFFYIFQDEVVAVKDAESPKGRIIVRAEDFSSWLVEDLKWNWGLIAGYHERSSNKLMMASNGIAHSSLLSNSKLDLSEVEMEKGLF